MKPKLLEGYLAIHKVFGCQDANIGLFWALASEYFMNRQVQYPQGDLGEELRIIIFTLFFYFNPYEPVENRINGDQCGLRHLVVDIIADIILQLYANYFFNISQHIS